MLAVDRQLMLFYLALLVVVVVGIRCTGDTQSHTQSGLPRATDCLVRSTTLGAVCDLYLGWVTTVDHRSILGPPHNKKRK